MELLPLWLPANIWINNTKPPHGSSIRVAVLFVVDAGVCLSPKHPGHRQRPVEKGRKKREKGKCAIRKEGVQVVMGFCITS